MSYSSAEIKSGLLITVSFVLLLALTFMVGRFVQGETYDYKIQFGYISGLVKDAPVYYAGHEVGKVGRIDILSGSDRPILLTVKIPRRIQLRKDTRAFIDTLGLLGEKFVELTPGALDSPAVMPGEILAGTNPIPMYQMIQKLNLLADRMDELTKGLTPLVQSADTLLRGNDEELAKIIANFVQVSSNLRDMTNDLKYRPWRLVRKGS